MKDIIIKPPKQQRSRDKFDAILQACARVFAEKGYKKTTTAAIAVEADVGIGTFYDYFSCKEAVFIAYLDHQLNQALEQVAVDVVEDKLDIQTSINTFIHIAVDFAHDQRELLKLFFTELPHLLGHISLANSREKITTIALAFANNKNIALPGKDSRLMIYSLTNIIVGFQCRIALLPDEGFSRAAIVEELSAIVLATIFPPAQTQQP